MSTYIHLNHYKCIRCKEKQGERVKRRTYTTCTRRLLETRCVEPGDTPYETIDADGIPFTGEAIKASISGKPRRSKNRAAS
ncbi:hypothetical protein RU639_012405 [Aspergillus parasiticus]